MDQVVLFAMTESVAVDPDLDSSIEVTILKYPRSHVQLSELHKIYLQVYSLFLSVL